MSFLLYLVVLVVSVTSVMMGLDWLSSPAPVVRPAVHTASAPAKLARVKRAKATTNTAAHKELADIKTDRKPVTAADTTSANAEAKATSGTGGNELARVAQGDNTVQAEDTDIKAPTEQATAAVAGPRCDVHACETYYRSFRASDCTYQPFDGPRRFCDRGHPPVRATRVVRTSDLRPASSSCNYQACAGAYRSFDPGTCTYQPYDGPRRLCEK